MMKRALALRPESYQSHPIHQPGRIWAETNCYADVWIELLHGLGFEPAASLSFTFAIDFEGDQWTFFKCPHADLLELYGLDVQELAIWRPLAEHVDEQIGLGRPVLVEVDAWYLPDTAGISYRQQHWKTTIAIAEIDLPRRRMGYFHNQGYYGVEGGDFAALLRLQPDLDDRFLAPYVEFVKLPRQPLAPPTVEHGRRMLARSLRRAPPDNPFLRFKTRLSKDLDWLLQAELDDFHRYSFATLRQYGACFELAQTFLQWLVARDESGLEGAIADLGKISETAKAFQFQLARAMSRRRPLDLTPLDLMGERWERTLRGLQSRYGTSG